jgi:hypothetical protein
MQNKNIRKCLFSISIASLALLASGYIQAVGAGASGSASAGAGGTGTTAGTGANGAAVTPGNGASINGSGTAGTSADMSTPDANLDSNTSVHAGVNNNTSTDPDATTNNTAGRHQ